MQHPTFFRRATAIICTAALVLVSALSGCEDKKTEVKTEDTISVAPPVTVPDTMVTDTMTKSINDTTKTEQTPPPRR